MVAHDDPAADEVRRTFWDERLRLSSELVDRSKARGELPAGASHAELLERVAAPIWMRALVAGLPIDREWIERLVDDTLAGAEAAVGAGRPPTGERRQSDPSDPERSAPDT